MDALTFLTDLVRSLAWPATVIVAVVVFRGPIAFVIRRTSAASFSKSGVDLAFDFRDGLAEIEKSLPPGGGSGRSASVRTSDDLRTGLPPAYVINTSWNKLEQALRRSAVAQDAGDGQDHFENAEGSARPTQMSAETAGLVRQLRRLRNGAVHGAGGLNETDALRFENAAAEVMAKLPGE